MLVVWLLGGCDTRAGVCRFFRNIIAILFVQLVFVAHCIAENSQPVSFPATGVWNSFLDHFNVVECNNHNLESVELSITVKGNDSAVLATLPAKLPGLSSQHFVLDMMPVGSYGTYAIDLVGGPSDAYKRISCLTAVYRFSYNNPNKEVDYAFVYPVVDPLQGVTGGLFNSMDPETSQRPTQNWLSIYNPSSEKFKATLEL